MYKSNKQLLFKQLNELKNNTVEFEEKMNELKNESETKDSNLKAKATRLRKDFDFKISQAKRHGCISKYDIYGLSRSLDGIITEYNDTKDYKQINSRIDDISKRTEDLKTSLDDLENKKEKTGLKELGSSITKLNNVLNKLKTMHGNLSGDINVLYEDAINKIGKIDEQITGIYNEIVDNVDKYAEISEIMTGISIIKKVREIRKALTGLESKSKSLLGAKGKIPNEISNLLKEKNQPTNLSDILTTIENYAVFFKGIELAQTEINGVDISKYEKLKIEDILKNATDAERDDIKQKLVRMINSICDYNQEEWKDNTPKEIEDALENDLKNIKASIEKAEQYCRERRAQSTNESKSKTDSTLHSG